MATYKKLNGPYTIETAEVIILGNLTVQGTQATIESTNTTVTDKIITLNVGELGNGIGPSGTGISGIEVDRGSQPNVSIVYDETVDRWRLSNDGSLYLNIYAGNATSVLSAVEEDPAPILGGNLKSNGYSILSGNSDNLKFEGNLQLSYSLATPALVSNAVVMHSKTPGGGVTGLYVVNSSVSGQELITKSRAFGLSLIL